MSRRGLSGLVLAGLLALAPQARGEESRAEVIHWWTSGGESAAVKVFADQFSAAGGTWIDTAIRRRRRTGKPFCRPRSCKPSPATAMNTRCR